MKKVAVFILVLLAYSCSTINIKETKNEERIETEVLVLEPMEKDGQSITINRGNKIVTKQIDNIIVSMQYNLILIRKMYITIFNNGDKIILYRESKTHLYGSNDQSQWSEIELYKADELLKVYNWAAIRANSTDLDYKSKILYDSDIAPLDIYNGEIAIIHRASSEDISSLYKYYKLKLGINDYLFEIYFQRVPGAKSYRVISE